MYSYIFSSLRRAPLRPLVLALGLLVAAVSFSLLTSAVQTSQAQVRGTLNKNFRAAYDILVRPAGSQTQIEKSLGLVRPNFQSGIYGGITNAQWQKVLRLPGVEVAAPLANAGIIIPLAEFPVEIPEAESRLGAGHIYRVEQTWSAVRGTSRFPGNRDFVYSTTSPTACGELTTKAVVNSPMPRSAFDVAGAAGSSLYCFSRGQSSNGDACWQLQPNYFGPNTCGVTEFVTVAYPLAIAGIDPVQESKLLGLNRATVSGSGLTEGETYSVSEHGSVVPVIASSRTYADIALSLNVDRVGVPAGASVPAMLAAVGKNSLNGGTGVYRLLRSLPVGAGRTVRFTADQLYAQALDALSSGYGNSGLINEYWNAGPVTYTRGKDGVLHPRPQALDQSVYNDGAGVDGWAYVNPASADTQYRPLQIHLPVTPPPTGSDVNAGQGELNIVGRFDPAKLRKFSPLSQVPLETYDPPVAVGADAASATVLGGAPYRPTLNLGGYLIQPPELLTTIRGIQGFTSSKFYADGSDPAPISDIRVRVAGVTGTDALSVARIDRVATLIHERTGLAVDITAGSSPAPQTVALGKSPFGTPALRLRENWVKKGVNLVITAAIDHKSLLLLVMILLVTVVFLLNAGVASVRSRRSELGTLLCLGWRPGQVAASVLGELVVVGVAAGAVGTALAFALSAALDLNQPAWRFALVAPVSIALATLAGLIPAVLAARGDPLDVIAPRVPVPRRAPRRATVTRLAVNNLRRARGRTVLAALALYIGVAALTSLSAITTAFHGAVIGTLLGDVVTVQVRGTDYVIVTLILLLAAVALTDTLVLGMRERAVELVTLRVLGWSDLQLARLIITEGLAIGLLGAGLGALTGAEIGHLLGAPSAALIHAAVTAAAIGLAAAAIASLGPAVAISRLSIGIAAAEA